jgi:hypothetical protein
MRYITCMWSLFCEELLYNITPYFLITIASSISMIYSPKLLRNYVQPWTVKCGHHAAMQGTSARGTVGCRPNTKVANNTNALAAEALGVFDSRSRAYSYLACFQTNCLSTDFHAHYSLQASPNCSLQFHAARDQRPAECLRVFLQDLIKVASTRSFII